MRGIVAIYGPVVSIYWRILSGFKYSVQSVTISMTESTNLYSYQEFPFSMRFAVLPQIFDDVKFRISIK